MTFQIYFLSVDSVPARDTPGSSDPVPIAGDRRGDESNYGGGAGCEGAISILIYPHFKRVFLRSMGSPWIVQLRIKRHRTKVNKEVLFTHFDYDSDSVKVGLSLPGFLLLEYPQTMYSI